MTLNKKITEEIVDESSSSALPLAGGITIERSPLKVATVILPSKGKILQLSPFSLGCVESALVYEGQIIVTFRTILYDYTGESDSIELQKSFDLNIGSSFTLATDAFINSINANIAYKNVMYSKSTGQLVYKLSNRVAANTQYYFINDRIMLESAIDDGLSTGIHKDRFNRGNYLSPEAKTHFGNAMVIEMASTLTTHALSGGNY